MSTTSQGFHLARLGDGRVLLEPQHGINPAAEQSGLAEILVALREARANTLLYDLSGITVIDAVYYRFLNQLANGCHALGVRMVCINMRPTAACALASEMRDPPRFETAVGLEDVR